MSLGYPRAGRQTLPVPIPELVCHRGFAGRYPENTLSAIRGALEVKASWIEIDVQLSADGEVVLFHDETTDRMCGVPGSIHERTVPELAKLRAPEPQRFGARFPDERIATLHEVVALLRESELTPTLFVEVKPIAVEHHGVEFTLARVLEALAPIHDQCVLISFVLDLLVAAKGKLPLGFIVKHFDEISDGTLDELDPEYVFCNHEKIPADASLEFDFRLAVYEVVDPALALELGRRGAPLVETFEYVAMSEALAAAARDDA